LIRGLVQDTLHINEPVCLAHIDVDWYEPVLICLERIEPHLSVGGTLVIDDYLAWSGCQRAVDEYFDRKDRSRYQFDTSPGSLLVTKLS
jgi:O-methyltransferase